MSAISDLLTLGIKSLETDIGSPTFTYAGTSYACVPNTLSKGTVLSLGGKEWVISLTLNARQSLFGVTKPFAGKLVTYLTKTYRILSVEADGTGTNYSIHLADNDR